MTVGSHTVDDEDEQTVRRSLVLGKLKTVGAVIEHLDQRGSQDPEHTSSSTELQRCLVDALQRDIQRTAQRLKQTLDRVDTSA